MKSSFTHLAPEESGGKLSVAAEQTRQRVQAGRKIIFGWEVEEGLVLLL